MQLVSQKAVIVAALASSMSAMGNSREGAFISANQLNLVHQIEPYSGRSDKWKKSHDKIFRDLMEFYSPMFKSQLAIPSDDETSDLSDSHSMEKVGISVSTRAPHVNFFTIVTHMGTCTIQIPADKGYLGVSTN